VVWPPKLKVCQRWLKVDVNYPHAVKGVAHGHPQPTGGRLQATPMVAKGWLIATPSPWEYLTSHPQPNLRWSLVTFI
jgi:hypothetical protein